MGEFCSRGVYIVGETIVLVTVLEDLLLGEHNTKELTVKSQIQP
jgi:hypothetical protein